MIALIIKRQLHYFFIIVRIDFAIDENGKVIEEYLSLPFHEAFDQNAFKVINNSPPWLTAISHNRKVKAYRRQPVTFVQP